jgi:hypothetical protein
MTECPECGSTDINEDSDWSHGDSPLGVLITGKYHQKWYCRDCGCEFYHYG